MGVQNEAKDPGAAALLAVEEALNLVKMESVGQASRPAVTRAQPERSSDRRDPGQSDSRRPDSVEGDSVARLDDASAAPEVRPLDESSRSAARLMTETGLHANDDRRSVGQMLQALSARPSATPFLVAGLGSLLWAAVCVFGVSQSGLFDGGFSAASASRPEALLAFGATVGPVVLFFILAALMRRMQEMRLTTRSMAEIAVRLAEPETFATEQVLSLSHAIRREVASMGDGIERAHARAGELETLVRSEVANLERSYAENERRIRSMIDELANEREAIVANADRVRGAIAGAHEAIARDLDAASLKIAGDVAGASARAVAALGAKGEDITYAMAQAGGATAAHIESHGAEIAGRLVATTQEVTAKLNEATGSVARDIAEQVGSLDERLRRTSDDLVDSLVKRGEDVALRVEEIAVRIGEDVASRGDMLAARLDEDPAPYRREHHGPWRGARSRSGGDR